MRASPVYMGLLPVLACLVWSGSALAAHTVTVESQTPGPTPFIDILQVKVSEAPQLTSVQFTVMPKTGSVTRPISATYSAAYLIARGYWNGKQPMVQIPIFGLYANASNVVAMSYSFSGGGVVLQNTTFVTAAYTDPCNVFNNRTVVVSARQQISDLSFDYFLVKKYCSTSEPTILDTDGEVRWTGTGMAQTQAAILFQNHIYVSNGQTALRQVEFDGSYADIADYASIGVTSTYHHNFDPGKTGIVMDVDTTTQLEATAMEVDSTGKVLNIWDFSKILGQAMTAGGDDPTKFIQPTPTDWFHLNATTYNPADNTLIASSRENFVIAVDYDTQQIKWILGDPTKHWYQFPSLRKFALHTATRYPIGQHAISIDDLGDLLLMDDGLNSLYQQPPGKKRTFTAPRAYHIDLPSMTATQTYDYTQMESIYSMICSSVYEDAPNNFMIDYSYSQSGSVMELVGLTAGKKKVFDYQYPEPTGCSAGWNTEITHLENLQF